MGTVNSKSTALFMLSFLLMIGFTFLTYKVSIFFSIGFLISYVLNIAIYTAMTKDFDNTEK